MNHGRTKVDFPGPETLVRSKRPLTPRRLFSISAGRIPAQSSTRSAAQCLTRKTQPKNRMKSSFPSGFMMQSMICTPPTMRLKVRIGPAVFCAINR